MNIYKRCGARGTGLCGRAFLFSAASRGGLGISRKRNKRQFITKGLGDLCDGFKSGAALFGKGLVQTGSGNTGGSGRFCHGFTGPGDMGKCGGQIIVIPLLKNDIKIIVDIIFSFEIINNVKFFCFQHLQPLCQFFGFLDILFLCGLVPSAEQYDDPLSLIDEVQAVTGAITYFCFKEAIAQRPGFSKGTGGHNIDSFGNKHPCFTVSDVFKPCVKFPGGLNLIHTKIVVYTRQEVKRIWNSFLAL